MDDLGDDSVQLVARITREAFEMWMRSNSRGTGQHGRSAASDLADAVESGDVREANEAEAEECGWTQITLASTDLDGIQSRLEEQGVLFQVNERLDGDIDVYFQASSEDVIREALADIIANDALSQNGEELDYQDAYQELDSQDYTELDADDQHGTPDDEDIQKCDSIEDQIEDAKRSEMAREEVRAEQSKERTMSQDIER